MGGEFLRRSVAVAGFLGGIEIKVPLSFRTRFTTVILTVISAFFISSERMNQGTVHPQAIPYPRVSNVYPKRLWFS